MGASNSGVLIAAAPREPIAGRVKAWLRDQALAQHDRWRLGAPVAYGGGAALYFALLEEPPLWPLALMAAVAAGVWVATRRLGFGRGVTVPLMILACFALGLAAAKHRTIRVAEPIAPALIEPTMVEGWVVDVDSAGANGARVVLAPVRIRGLEPEQTPIRLRATVRGEPPPPGSAVRLFAILNPPPPPAAPGGYDFGRNAFFLGLGGTAFGLGPTREATLPEPPRELRWRMALNAMRYGLASRIVERLGPESGGITAAMTTGHETWISEEQNQVMRDSGLYHIISISGLHMAIVGGFVFFATRLLVAGWPWLALRVSSKKVAAWAGLAAVGGYLLISGGPPPAERAAITASVAFIAILLDRRAISMNALAVAALIVLTLRPESIVQPGFQMSFAATAALVALAEAWPRQMKPMKLPIALAAIQKIWGWLLAAGAASLVAGLATGPFAMQHFNRTAVYGLIANVAVSPISSFVMMPALALGAALTPFGLGGPFLDLAGRCVDLMLAIGTWTSSLPGAVRNIPSAPAVALPIAFLGLLTICLWRGRLRWLALPMATAVLWWPREPTPDIWIGDGGTNGAWTQADQATAVRPTVREFALDLWSRRRGQQLQAPPEGELDCGRFSCAPTETGPLAIWWGRRAPDAEQLSGLCATAGVVSVRGQVVELPAACDGRLVLDGVDYARGGSIELWRDGDDWRAVWAADDRGDRPWSRSSA